MNWLIADNCEWCTGNLKLLLIQEMYMLLLIWEKYMQFYLHQGLQEKMLIRCLALGLWGYMNSSYTGLIYIWVWTILTFNMCVLRTTWNVIIWSQVKTSGGDIQSTWVLSVANLAHMLKIWWFDCLLKGVSTRYKLMKTKGFFFCLLFYVSIGVSESGVSWLRS